MSQASPSSQSSSTDQPIAGTSGLGAKCEPGTPARTRAELADMVRKGLEELIASGGLKDAFDERTQPLYDRIQTLEDENRRQKIGLDFLESQLKEAKSLDKKKAAVSVKDASIQVEEMDFLKVIEPEEKKQQRLNSRSIDSSLKRSLNDRSPDIGTTNRHEKRFAAVPPVAAATLTTSSSNMSKNTITYNTRITAKKSTGGSFAAMAARIAAATLADTQKQPAAAVAPKPITPAPLAIKPAAVAPMTGIPQQAFRFNGAMIAAAQQQQQQRSGTGVLGKASAPPVNIQQIQAQLNNLNSGSYVLINQSGQIGGLILHPGTTSQSTISIGPAASKSMTVTSGSSASTLSFAAIAPKPAAGSISAFRASPTTTITPIPYRSAALALTAAPTAATSSGDTEGDIEVLPPPPKPPSPQCVNLSDDEDEQASLETEKEIPSSEGDCVHHPFNCPALPFLIQDKILPRPRLSLRIGSSKDKKKAVILRMESEVDSSKCTGFLQYRIYSYFQNVNESTADRKWKQLTCIKVKCGRICECTLTQLVDNARYHFVVCLVNGDNRSKFSNCATTKF